MNEGMPSIEATAKAQFAKVFTKKDWPLFKLMADRYFSRAAHLRRADMTAFPADKRLLARNIEKRLLIGIGTELLLKALYLRHGFVINKAGAQAPKFPFSDAAAKTAGAELDPNDTYKLNDLIQCLHRVPAIGKLGALAAGLQIAKVFRNKEGHVVVGKHQFNAKEYTEVANALVGVYLRGFDQVLEVTFSVESNQKARWRTS